MFKDKRKAQLKVKPVPLPVRRPWWIRILRWMLPSRAISGSRVVT